MTRCLAALAALGLAACTTGTSDGGVPDLGTDADVASDLSSVVDAPVSSDLGRDGARDLGPALDLGLPDLGAGHGGLWMRGMGAIAWNEYDRGEGGTTAYAPTLPVEEGFALDGCDEAYVLTHGWYHVLRLSDHTWVRSGVRGTIFSELGAQTIVAASAVGPRDYMCTGTAEYVVTLRSATDAVIYTFTKGGGFVYVRTDAMPWASDPGAPDPATVRAAWFSFANDEGWLAGSPHDVCPTDPSMPAASDPYAAYTAFVTSDAIYFTDDTFCHRFVSHVDLATFAPLTLPGAPPASAIGAMFFGGNALWVVRE